jgi:hypothetical protein
MTLLASCQKKAKTLSDFYILDGSAYVESKGSGLYIACDETNGCVYCKSSKQETEAKIDCFNALKSQ